MKDINKLKLKIELLRNELNNIMLTDDEHGIQNKENILKRSQELDLMITEFTKAVNLPSIKKLENIFGVHTFLYYYNVDHLCSNISRYILAGINQNEKVLFYMNDDLYEKIISKEEELYKNKKYLGRIDMEKIYKLFKVSKNQPESHLFNSLEDEYRNKDFTGVRIIADICYFISNNNQKNFLNFETVVSQGIKNKAISVLCIYNIEEVAKMDLAFDIIKESLETHNYKM